MFTSRCLAADRVSPGGRRAVPLWRRLVRTGRTRRCGAGVLGARALTERGAILPSRPPGQLGSLCTWLRAARVCGMCGVWLYVRWCEDVKWYKVVYGGVMVYLCYITCLCKARAPFMRLHLRYLCGCVTIMNRINTKAVYPHVRPRPCQCARALIH